MMKSVENILSQSIQNISQRSPEPWIMSNDGERIAQFLFTVNG